MKKAFLIFFCVLLIFLTLSSIMSCTAKRTDFNEATESSDNSAESSLPTTTSSATISDNTGNPSFILGNHDIREYALVTENEKE